MSQLVLLIMTGTHAVGEAEAMLARARQAITQDLVERARTIPDISNIVVSTNSADLAEWAAINGAHAELDVPTRPFHFGQTLARIADKYQADRLLYMGGGSAALLSRREMLDIVRRVCSADRVLITNNYYSTDFAAFAPASALHGIDLPEIDNDLGWLLGEQAGLPNEALPRTASTQFDVDTPTDLVILKTHPEVGPHVRAFLDHVDLDSSRVETAMGSFTDRNAEILVAGRVSSAIWQYLERETACRVRVFAEERGMRASGRQERGEVRSILGYYYEQVGAGQFFETLAHLGQAVFLDSRVIFCHLGVWPAANDRYNSDLYRPDKIADQVVREFTRAAMGARIPVVLGGHSLVAGGLYALVESAWQRSRTDVPRYVDHMVCSFERPDAPGGPESVS